MSNYQTVSVKIIPKQAFVYSVYQGPYYVQYKDGEKSMCMSYSVACSYADIFGGTVIRHPDCPTIFQRIKKLILSKKKV